MLILPFARPDAQTRTSTRFDAVRPDVTYTSEPVGHLVRDVHTVRYVARFVPVELRLSSTACVPAGSARPLPATLSTTVKPLWTYPFRTPSPVRLSSTRCGAIA